MRTSVTDFLDSRNVPYQVKAHNEPVFTCEDAARQRRVRLSQIVKTILLKGQDDRIVVALLPGHKKLALKKLKRVSGHKSLEFMDRNAIEKELGVVVGAMAPISPALEGLPVFIDPSVFEEEVVDISSGDPRAGVELSREDFRDLLAHAMVTEIVKSQ